MKHIDWNFGILEDVLGSMGRNKTTSKTLCEKTVSVSMIDNHNPTCEECKAIKRETEELAKLLQNK